MPDEFKYDVFLSHSSKDKAVVRPIAEQLRKDGLRVWFDEWEIYPGDSIPAKIEEGLEHSRVLVLCMSANAFGADWTELEASTFRFRDPLGRDGRFVPLRLDEAPIKGSLAQLLYINWLRDPQRQEYDKLLRACQPPQGRQASASQATKESLSVEAEQEAESGPSAAGFAPSPMEVEPHKRDHKAANPRIDVFRGKEYVYVPAGRFTMGTCAAHIQRLNELDHSQVFSREQPEHTVTVAGFFLARYPVTHGEYREFTHATGRRTVPYRDDFFSIPYNWNRDSRMPPPDKENHPVVLVSWRDACAYCEWLGGRLPTEAEWEKAARGTYGWEWPWGDTWRDGACNTEETGHHETTPVGHFSPRGDSFFGVSDMAGNVWEWCSSTLDPYPYNRDDGREAANSLGQRVLRGGNFGLSRNKARCAFRNSECPDNFGFNIGFRVAFSSLPAS